MLIGKVIKMLDYKLLKEEGKVLVNENEKNVFEANIIINDDVAWLDMISLGHDKTQNLQNSGSFIKGSFDLLSVVTAGVKGLLRDNGVDVKHVILGDFADVKRYDMAAAEVDEQYIKEQTKVRLTSRR